MSSSNKILVTPLQYRTWEKFMYEFVWCSPRTKILEPLLVFKRNFVNTNYYISIIWSKCLPKSKIQSAPMISAGVCLLGPAPSAYLPQGPAHNICRSKGRSTGRSTGRRTQTAGRNIFHICVREIAFIHNHTFYKQQRYEFCCRLCRFCFVLRKAESHSHILYEYINWSKLPLLLRSKIDSNN